MAYLWNEEAETIEEACKAFPDKLGRLVILSCPDDEPVMYISPAVADQLTDAAIKEAAEKGARYIEENRCGGYAQKNALIGGTRVELIVLTPSNTLEQALRKLNHELGHLILKNGSSSSNDNGLTGGNLAEKAADAYEALRHIQCAGKSDFEDFRDYAEILIEGLVKEGDTAHYTLSAIDRAVQIAKKKDITDLSLRQTATLAEYIAAECQLSNEKISDIRRAFRSINRFYESPVVYNEEHFCEEALAVMKEHPTEPHILRFGLEYLCCSAQYDFMRSAARSKEHWQKALDLMDSYEAKINKLDPEPSVDDIPYWRKVVKEKHPRTRPPLLMRLIGFRR